MGSDATYREAPYQEKQPRKVSIETFLQKYRKGGPGEKYEYNQGIIEKTDAMKANERYIIFNLRESFASTPAAQEKGSLECETEVWISKDKWRKPDLSYLTIEQTRMAIEGAEPMPGFVIEVISPNDKITIVKDKVYEYFEAGVKILWHIFPHLNMVEIYRSPKNIEVCSGSTLCSAEPVADGFKIKAEDIFKKP